MCNLKAARKLHSTSGNESLAFELTVLTGSGPLITLRALETPAGLIWTYELGTAAIAAKVGCASATTAARVSLQ